MRKPAHIESFIAGLEASSQVRSIYECAKMLEKRRRPHDRIVWHWDRFFEAERYGFESKRLFEALVEVVTDDSVRCGVAGCCMRLCISDENRFALEAQAEVEAILKA